jgi:hypothetical protein
MKALSPTYPIPLEEQSEEERREEIVDHVQRSAMAALMKARRAWRRGDYQTALLYLELAEGRLAYAQSLIERHGGQESACPIRREIDRCSVRWCRS